MDQSKNKTIFSFKTRKDQVVATISSGVVITVLGYLGKCVVSIIKIIAIVGTLATVQQVSDSATKLQSYCDAAISSEKQDRKSDVTAIQIDIRQLRDQCREFWDKYASAKGKK